MNRRVLIYAPFAAWSPHFETDLEIAERHLAEGDEVTLLTCHGQLPTCEPNREHTLGLCAACRARSRAGIDWLGRERVRAEEFYRLTRKQEATVAALDQVELATLEELRAFQLDGSDVGLAALSSSVDELREPRPDMRKDRATVIRNLKTAAIAHFSLSNHLDEKRPDRLVLFNGRMSALRPAMRAAQKRGIEVIVHERGGYLNQFSATEGTSPHDLDVLQREYRDIFEAAEAPLEAKWAEGVEWFEERMRRQMQNFGTYVGNQSVGALPAQLQEYRLKIAIFLSTEAEFVAVEGWGNRHYEDQNDGLRQIFRDCADIPDLGFFVRVHPAMIGCENSQTAGIREAVQGFDNVVLLPAESPIDTYALLRSVDLVLTFGSTVTVEAMYLERPCILLGRQIVEDPTAVIIPEDHAELLALLKKWSETRALPETPNAKAAAVRYGYMQRHLGTEYRYVRPIDVFRASLHKNGVTRTLSHDRLLLHLSGLESRLNAMVRRAKRRGGPDRVSATDGGGE
jgi:hypothetical protein